MKIALYYRSSRIKPGNTELHGISSQRSACSEYATRTFPSAPLLEFCDKNISGKRSSRPSLNRLKALIRSGQITHIIVSDISRIARSLRDLLELEEFFQTHEVHFVSLKEQIDTSTPTGKLIFQIMGAIGEFGSSISRERSLAIVDQCRKKGIQLGRKPTAFPSETIQRIQQSHSTGQSYRQIANAEGIPLMTAYRLIKRNSR